MRLPLITTSCGTPPRLRTTHRFVILTGLSGSGKTHAIRALEDLGYFCVDNLPSQLIPTFAELASRGDAGLERVAIVVDVREGGFLKQFPKVYRKLKSTPGVEPRLIFLEANRSSLVRRRPQIEYCGVERGASGTGALFLISAPRRFIGAPAHQ